MSILVFGPVALDIVETPCARVEEVLGGAATYFSTAASLYNQVNFGADGSYLSAPAYPLEEVIDPTGAGDAFAGGFLGYLSTVQPGPDGCYSIDDIKCGVVDGNVLGSFVCVDFSIGRLRTLTMKDVVARYQALVASSHFDPDWHTCPSGKAIHAGDGYPVR